MGCLSGVANKIIFSCQTNPIPAALLTESTIASANGVVCSTSSDLAKTVLSVSHESFKSVD